MKGEEDNGSESLAETAWRTVMSRCEVAGSLSVFDSGVYTTDISHYLTAVHMHARVCLCVPTKVPVTSYKHCKNISIARRPNSAEKAREGDSIREMSHHVQCDLQATVTTRPSGQAWAAAFLLSQ